MTERRFSSGSGATNLMMISKNSVCDIVNSQQPPKAYVIAPPLLAPEDQRRPRGVQWGALHVNILKMLDWFAQASICQPGNPSIIFALIESKWMSNPARWFAFSMEHQLELFNLTGTPWASHACTLLLCLSFFEQLKSHGTGQMTLTSPGMSAYFVTPTSNHFCQGLHIRCFQLFVSTRKTEPQSVGKEGTPEWPRKSSAPPDKFATKNRVPDSGSVVTAFRMLHVSKWCLANFGPASSFSCSVFRFNSKSFSSLCFASRSLCVCKALYFPIIFWNILKVWEPITNWGSSWTPDLLLALQHNALFAESNQLHLFSSILMTCS